ncbi:MAG: hypothetical protein A2158_06500 [Chloroflexi bacterium RBG_13_46_14]|nr:MAG: hypothetical protein A2158_06500 [Chloroflexi bacterium RBG_13_46_14]
MSAIRFDMKDISKVQPRDPAISRAILFNIPSIVWMAESSRLSEGNHDGEQASICETRPGGVSIS